MKKLIVMMMVLLMAITLCACGSDDSEKKGSDFKMTTDYAAEQSVKDALKEWMSTKMLSFECTEFKYNITSTERSTRSFSGDDESGTMWYNAYGTVSFYNDYGDVLAKGKFSVFFGHNGVDSFSYIGEETVVNIIK